MYFPSRHEVYRHDVHKHTLSSQRRLIKIDKTERFTTTLEAESHSLHVLKQCDAVANVTKRES